MLILDIDFDFFVEPIVTGRLPSRRPSDKHSSAWVWDRIRTFVEQQLLLDRDQKVPGAVFEEHVSAFNFVMQLGGEGHELVHIDAHADLGMGGYSFVEICEDLLHRPVSERIPKSNRRSGEGLNSSNWLAYLLAQGRLETLTMVFPQGWQGPPYGGDLPGIYWRSGRPEDGPVELPILPKGGFEDWAFGCRSHPEGRKFEHPVRYQRYLGNAYRSPRTPDYVILVKSPRYTPRSSDSSFELLSDYISQIPGA